MTREYCSKCGRERPTYIYDPTCAERGYCHWTEVVPPPGRSSLVRTFFTSVHANDAGQWTMNVWAADRCVGGDYGDSFQNGRSWRRRPKRL